MIATCSPALQSRVAFLRQISIFEDLGDEVLLGIAAELKQVDFKAEEVIIHEGDDTEGLFIVAFGCVQLRASGVEFSIISSGNYFGEQSLIAGDSRNLTASAISDTTLYYWDKESFESVASKEAKMLKTIIMRLFERLKKKALLEDDLVQKTAQIKAQSQLISAQKNALQDLVESKDQLLTIIAHDLKNPFNLILGLSEMLINVPNLPEPKRLLFTEKLNHSAKDVYSLLENLLGWSRCNNGENHCQPEIINLRNLILNNICLYKNVAESKNITLFVEEDHAEAYADIQMIDTVIRNLLGNAIKFTESGSIQMSCEDCGEYSRFSITDSGVGMQSHVAQQLLCSETLYTTRGTRDEKGTGLGLKLCQRFVDANHGTISVVSAVGIGTSFHVTLPKPK